jgi:long-chain-fatty-acid---luciferin-component ligase
MQPVGQFSLVESVLYGEDDVYRLDASQRLAFQFEVIREAFEFHYDNCQIYRRFCTGEGITPSSVSSAGDITKIPLIPSSMFKSLEIRTVPEEQIVKVCRSSGTRGGVSRVPRDDSSLERFVGSVRISADQLLGLRPEAQIFNLGPETGEAGDVWFPYVMSLLGLLRPAENYVIDNVFYPRLLVENLVALPATTQPVFVGPPIFFVYLMRFLEEHGECLDLGSRGGLVITAGGWKSFSTQQINREMFTARCVDFLGVSDRRQVRDAYNMVELNTVIFECELGVKHLPPWLVAVALDPGTLTPVLADDTGLLAFFDPLPTSYPGFILSDDFGRVGSGPCGCGREGPTMEFCRRVALAEGRGCALTMDRDTGVSHGVSVSGRAHEKF